MNDNLKNYALTYFLGRCIFLGFGFSLLFKICGKDTWIAGIIGIIIGGIIIKLLEKIDFKETVFFRIFFLIFNLFAFSQMLFIFETFASSFFLIKSPHYFILLPIPFIIYRICKNGYVTIKRVAEALMPISFIIFALGILGLTNNWTTDYFLPVLTTDFKMILLGSIYFAFYSTAPYFLLLKVDDNHNILKPYLFSALTVLITCTFIIAVLGPNLIMAYRYPEYMALKKIKLFNFIEKVENIAAIAWLFDLFLTLSLAGCNIKECLPKKHNKYIFIGVLFLLYLLAILSGIYYEKELIIYHNLPIILGGFIIIIFILLFKKNRIFKK